MDFAFFILVTATLFIRPAEIVEEVAAWPIYWYLILACTVAALQPVLRQLNSESLSKHPITAGMVGMLVAVFLSHLAHFQTIYAREQTLEFLKVVIYFLLLVATVNTTSRLKTYLFVLVTSIIILSAIAVLQFHGYIDLPALTSITDPEFNPETGLVELVPRIQATGIYHDPNDLSMIVVLGMVICLWVLGNSTRSPLALAWAAPLILLGYTLFLTKSRGGFLGLLAALLTFCLARFGWRKSIPLVVVGLPLMFVLFAGRQTGLSNAVQNDTGQGRLQLWVLSFGKMKPTPVFGIGATMLESGGDQTCHNTFVQCFCELGLIGGTIFAGIYAYSAYSLFRLKAAGVTFFDHELARLRPYLLALLAGYSFGMVSLSRAYIVPTYLVPGLVCAYLCLVQTAPPLSPLPLNSQLLRRAAVVGAASLTFFYLFARVLRHLEEASLSTLPNEVEAPEGAEPVAAAISARSPDVADVSPRPGAAQQLSSTHQPITVIAPPRGWQLVNVRELWQFRELVYFLVWRDVKVRYKQTALGASWAILQPLLMMIIFNIVFGRLGGVNTGGIPYPLFAFAGLLPWTFFATSITNAGNSVVGSERLITKIYFPRLAVPFASVGAALVDFCIAFGMLLVLMIWYQTPPGIGFALAPVLLLLILMAALGIGTLLAALNVAYRDFKHALPFLVQLWMFGTPTVYLLPGEGTFAGWRQVLLLNPMIGLVGAFRTAVLGGPIDWPQLALAAATTVCLFVAGCFYFRKVEDSFADLI